MRGLPPIPADVLSVELTFLQGTSPATSKFWVLIPGSVQWTQLELEELRSQIEFTALGIFPDICSNATSLSTCRIRQYSGSRLQAIAGFSGNSGAGPQPAAVNTAYCFLYYTTEAGHGGTTRYWIPGVALGYSNDYRTLNADGLEFAVDAAGNWLEQVNAIVVSVGSPCIMGTVHRARAGQPLPVATFAPFQGFGVSRVIGTMRRRMRDRSHI